MGVVAVASGVLFAVACTVTCGGGERGPKIRSLRKTAYTAYLEHLPKGEKTRFAGFRPRVR